MERLDRVAAVVVTGFVVLLVVSAMTVADHRSTGVASPAEELVSAWSGTRTLTHRSLGTFERVGADGARLAAPTEVVQRPPDRLLRGFDEVSGRRDDRALDCPAPVGGGGAVGASSPSGDELACTLGPPGVDFDEVVAAEVEAFSALVVGDDPLYEVADDERDGCFALTRTRYDPRAGYGAEATMCFDEATGALRSIRIDHGAVVETTVYDDITTTVTDADLEP